MFLDVGPALPVVDMFTVCMLGFSREKEATGGRREAVLDTERAEMGVGASKSKAHRCRLESQVVIAFQCWGGIVLSAA